MVRHDRHREPGGEDDGCRAELRGDLRDRRQAERVVEQARDEEDRAPAENAEDLLVRARDRTEREGGADAGREAGEDADAAEVGRRARVPAVLARRRDEKPGGGRAEQQKEDECGDGIRED